MIKRFFTSVLFVLCAFAAFSAFSQSALPTATADPNTDPRQLLRQARTVYVHSNTDFLIPDTMDRALMQQKQWRDLGLTLVGDPKAADLHLELDRQIFTHIHTFVLSDRQTTVVLGSGRQWGLNGTLAAGGLAEDIVKLLAAARLSRADPKS